MKSSYEFTIRIRFTFRGTFRCPASSFGLSSIGFNCYAQVDHPLPTPPLLSFPAKFIELNLTNDPQGYFFFGKP